MLIMIVEIIIRTLVMMMITIIKKTMITIKALQTNENYKYKT